MALTGVAALSTLALTAQARSAAPKAPTFTLPASLKGPAPSAVHFSIGPQYAVVALAEGLGYFDQVPSRFHTQIDFDYVPVNGPEQVSAFLGGSEQWMATGMPGALLAMIEGPNHKDIVAVFNQTGLTLGTVVGAEKDKATKGTNIAAFGAKGVNWCDATPVGIATTFIELVAAHYHVDLSHHPLTSTGSTGASLDALKSGRCDIMSGTPTPGIDYLILNASTPTTSAQLAGDQLGQEIFTSHAFADKYPQLTQAMVDALTKALTVAQADRSKPEQLYRMLPTKITANMSLAMFKETLSLGKDLYSPKYNDGSFLNQAIADSTYLNEAAQVIPVGSKLNPSDAFSNKYVAQAYKSVGISRPGGPQAGPTKLPAQLAKPSREMAEAFAELTGKPAPVNDGTAPFAAA